MVPKNKKNMHLLIYIILTVLPWTRSELFTAIIDVKPLLETHQRVIDDLDHYLKLEEGKLVMLKKHLNHYKKEQEKAMEDIPNYLGNPINAFTLIKRLTKDLDKIEHSIQVGTEFIKNVTIYHKDVKYPTSEDLLDAAHALIGLQKTCKLNTTDLANGMLNGIVYSTPMTTSDCFELARALYTEKDYTNALPWFMETLLKYKEEEFNYFSLGDVLAFISVTHYWKNDFKTALEWTHKLLEVEPDHAHGNVPHYLKHLKEQEAKWEKQQRGETLEEAEDEIEKYQRLCRDEMELPAFYSKKLYCRYLTENHPFLKLAPIKMEYIYRNPDIIVFHQVLSDDEIEFIQTQAKLRFTRAEVSNLETDGFVSSNYRIGNSARLRAEESPIIAAVNQRVADMTGLSLDSSDQLEVVNYGIRKTYEPHYDFARKCDTPFPEHVRNRIATVLFYMSEVAQGGATVFTHLGISVFPIKGAALFWLNLHPSGEGDLSTRHAACPVLRGSKWVCKKWLHQVGQELLRPCGLRYQGEDFLHKVPRAVPKTAG